MLGFVMAEDMITLWDAKPVDAFLFGTLVAVGVALLSLLNLRPWKSIEFTDDRIILRRGTKSLDIPFGRLELVLFLPEIVLYLPELISHKLRRSQTQELNLLAGQRHKITLLKEDCSGVFESLPQICPNVITVAPNCDTALPLPPKGLAATNWFRQRRDQISKAFNGLAAWREIYALVSFAISGGMALAAIRGFMHGDGDKHAGIGPWAMMVAIVSLVTGIVIFSHAITAIRAKRRVLGSLESYEHGGADGLITDGTRLHIRGAAPERHAGIFAKSMAALSLALFWFPVVGVILGILGYLPFHGKNGAWRLVAKVGLTLSSIVTISVLIVWFCLAVIR